MAKIDRLLSRLDKPSLRLGLGLGRLGAAGGTGGALRISGTPATAVQNVPYSFMPTTLGGSGTRAFVLTGTLPTGLTFSTTTGAITGTPTVLQTASGLTITVTDATGSAGLGPFSITVAVAAPVFSVQPSISPGSGTAGVTLFTASDGTASGSPTYTRRWLLDAVSIGTGTTVTPASAGSLVLEVTATNAGGPTIATSSAVTVSAGASYDADVIAYDTAQQAAGGAALTDPRKALLTTLVAGLKTDGVWTGFDRLTIMAAPNAFAARVDIKAPTKVLTIVGGVTFTADLGHTGDGTTGYLDTGEPVVGGTNQATSSNVSAGVYCNQQNGATTIKAHTGTAETSFKLYIGAIASGGAELYRANDITDSTFQAASSTRLGHRALTRTTGPSKRAFYNGVNTAATATGGNSASALNQLILRNSTASFGPDRVAVYWVGRAMTDAEQTLIHNRLNTFLTAIGGSLLLTGFDEGFNAVPVMNYIDEDKVAIRSDDAGRRAVRSIISHTTGKRYAELVAIGTNLRFGGVVDSTFTVNGAGGDAGTNRVGVQGQAIVSFGNLPRTTATADPSRIVRVAWDADAQLCWIKVGLEDWNIDPLADPETGVGGLSTAGLVGPGYIGATLRPIIGAGVQYREPTAVDFSLPVGFTEWSEP